jgi:nucleoside-diphosphate-sugar epimerase
VVGYARQRYLDLQAIGVEPIQGDIRDKEAVSQACARVDVVVHTAAVAGIWGDWDSYFQINVLGTRHVVEGCLAHGVSKLVYTSSPSVTFDGSDQRGVDESVPYAKKWLCHYPHSKALAEADVLRANGAGGLRTCALRPHLIWGPGDPHLIPRLIEKARRRELRQVGNGSNLIDITYVENAAEAHLRALDALQDGSPVCGGVYFISQGEPVNCWSWINDVLHLAGLPRVKKSISGKAAFRIGAVLECAHKLLRLQAEPRMTRFLAAQLSTSHYFDISRAKLDFGYSPTISTDEGMRRLADSMANR